MFYTGICFYLFVKKSLTVNIGSCKTLILSIVHVLHRNTWIGGTLPPEPPELNPIENMWHRVITTKSETQKSNGTAF
jgi:hypothetical protein